MKRWVAPGVRFLRGERRRRSDAGSRQDAVAGRGGTQIFFLQALIFGLLRGVKVRAAYAIGQGRPDDAIRYGQAGLLLGTAAAALVMLAARDVSPALEWLGVDPSTIAPARDYLAARSLGAVGTCAAAALVQ